MKNCSSIYNQMIKQLVERFNASTRPQNHFPTFHAGVVLHQFSFKEVKLTLVSHLQADGQEFVMKLYMGDSPEKYFASHLPKKFSTKRHRQNDPCVMKIIHDCQKGKESWAESQLPLRSSKWQDIAEFCDLFLKIYSKAKNGHCLD